ncbi:LysR family transcriptional regulator (plasmid) [Cupriavidus pinatubonensis]|nr:LysR family transcriptional regulator [Cupriavidus pinatubonensis]
MLTRRLSLNALRAFEATSRLRSMSAAADELCVTHGAVSRHIKLLEENLGVTLLTRGPHSTEATPAGRRLAEDLARAFGLIEASLDQFKEGPLTISCSPSVLMFWLLPRISHFNQNHPEVQLQFNMNYENVDFLRDRIAVAMSNSTFTPPPEVDLKDVALEEIGPVCAPDYAEAASIRNLVDLREAHLLATKTRPDAWQDWVSSVGLPGHLQPKQHYDHFYLLIQAAVCGLGVAVVPKMLVQNDLESGKLVAPFGFIPGGRKLVLWTASRLASRPDVKMLVEWLANELAKSNASGIQN